MPPQEVYSVDFSNGNLTPVSSVSWGDLVAGGSPDGTKSAEPVSRGLLLRAGRKTGDRGVSNSLYVLPPEGALPFQSRLRMRVWFEQPYARVWPALPVPPGEREGPVTQLENWAIGLKLKFGRAPDPDDEPFIAVTCQFNRRGDQSGIRVNGVGDDQADLSPYLDSPLDYQKYRAAWFPFWRPPRFMLEFNHCGIQAGPATNPPMDPPQLGYAVGSASLSIGARSDHRPFSNRALSTGEQDWIGALGVSLATIRGVGQYQVVLRRFTIDLW
jgi:hypothetical protein